MRFDRPLKASLQELVRWPVGHTDLRRAVLEANEAELDAIVRLFITEAPAKAFEKCPLAYEHMRHLLATELDVDPKEICLTGSARVGFAMPAQPVPPKVWGRMLAEQSDLDLFTVSPELFQRCVGDVDFVHAGKAISHKSTAKEREREQERWRGKADNMRRCLARGYFDTKHMPEGKSGPTTTKKIRLAMRLLHNSWESLGHQPVAAGLPSLRVYKSWSHARAQLRYNLRKAANAHQP